MSKGLFFKTYISDNRSLVVAQDFRLDGSDGLVDGLG